MKNLKYALFKGSRALDNAPETLKSTLRVASVLDIEFVDVNEFTCSGESHLEDKNEFLAILINARNIAYAEKEGLDIVTLSNVDFKTLKECKAKLDINSNLKTRINEHLKKINLQYSGKSQIISLCEVFVKFGLDKIKAKSSKDLSELAIAPYYGENTPKNANDTLDKVANCFNSTIIESELKNYPCGSNITIRNKTLATKLTGKILTDIVDNSANSILVACSHQYLNLDALQCSSAKAVGRDDINIPVFYLSQYIGLTLGIEPKELGLNQNIAEVSI